MAKVESRTGGELSTILGSDSDFEGRLTVKQSMRIDGRIRGEVTSAETITIGSNGAIEGDVTAKEVVMGGKITGTLTVAGKTVLERTSVLNGDLKTSRLVVEEGAVFNGHSDMGEAKPTAQAHPPRKIKLDEVD